MERGRLRCLQSRTSTQTNRSSPIIRPPLWASARSSSTLRRRTSRGLVLAKNMVFDAHDLSKLVYTLPGTLGMAQGALENVYALSVSMGVMASLNFVYELEGYTPVTRTLTRNADQMFFDRDGLLWFLSTDRGTLEAQTIQR